MTDGPGDMVHALILGGAMAVALIAFAVAEAVREFREWTDKRRKEDGR